MSFKVGDTVRIRRDLSEIDTSNKIIGMTDSMYKYAGSKFRISNVKGTMYVDDKFIYNLDGTGSYNWLEGWLEPAKKPKLTLKELL